MKLTNRIKNITPVIIIFMIAQATLLYFYVERENTSNFWMKHTHSVIEELISLYANVQAAQLGQMAYIATKQKSYLDYYKSMTGQLPYVSLRANNQGKEDNLILKNITSIRYLTKDSPTQQENINELEKLIKNELAFLQNTIDKYPLTEGSEKIGNSYPIDSVSPNLFLIRKKITEMLNEEDRLLTARESFNEGVENQFLYFLLFAVFLSYTILFSLIYLLLKSRNMMRESDERLQRAIAGTSDGLWDLNPITKEVYFSPRFKEILGYNDTELKSNIDDFNLLLHPDDIKRVWDEVSNHLEKKTPFSIEYRVKNKNGDYVWIESRGRAFWDETGNPSKMSGFITDITHRKEISQLKDDFVSTVSHELRTPLTSIRGALGLILGGTEGPLTNEIKHFLQIAYNNAERLIHLINDILDIDKLESGKMRLNLKAINIKDIVKQSVVLNQAYSDQYKVTINIVEPFDNIYVLGDGDRLIQVMINLLSNAVKYTASGTPIEVFSSQENNMIKISIADHGKGIPDKYHALLFNKFVQINDPDDINKTGTGLGLYVCKQIIEKLNGKIGFKSNKNKGTTFFFELPIINQNEFIQKENDKNSNQLTDKFLPIILYLEDDADLVKVITRRLNGTAKVISVSSLKSAQDILQQEWVDLILLDIVLPDENGLQLLELLGNSNSKPVVILSAVEVSESISRHVFATLLKSSTSETEIISTIKAALNKSLSTV